MELKYANMVKCEKYTNSQKFDCNEKFSHLYRLVENWSRYPDDLKTRQNQSTCALIGMAYLDHSYLAR